MKLFASPDFGASGMVALIVLVFFGFLFLLILFASWYTIRLLTAESRRDRRRGIRWAALLILALVGPSVSAWFFHCKPRADFERLLGGTDKVQITAIQIEGQGEKLVLNEAETMTYVSEAFRSNLTDWYDLGKTYYVTIFLSTGGSVDCWIYVPEERHDPFRPASFTLGYPEGLLDDRVRRCRISLPEPIPPELTQVLEKLRSQ